MLEDSDILGYSRIQGEKIDADIFTKQGWKNYVLDEIIRENKFKHAKSKDNWVLYENVEYRVWNFVTKREKTRTAEMFNVR